MGKKILPVVVLLLLIAVIGFGFHQAKQTVSIPVDFHKTTYSGSKTCKDCHQDRYDSWSETYHRTMTQEANSQSVVADFDGKAYTYWGYTIRPVKENNRYYFDYYQPEGDVFLSRLEITRTVGSRRYQQYLAQTENTEGNYYRLELLWHIEDKRWVHLNGAFLGSDHQAFSEHTGIWNQNCIFCHNTGIEPNMTNYDEIIQIAKAGGTLNLEQDSRFESKVSEIGIGCESCHSPAKTHVELSAGIFRKYYLKFTDDEDKSITHPGKLEQQESLSVCGQCHGQRIPKTLKMARTWMESGPTYRPGDELLDHINPVLINTQLPTKKSDIFATRFWKDGTPRLSAYEYQGILASKCVQDENLTCMSCHNMHGGDVKGMIDEEKRTNQACASCHQELVDSPSAHTGHKDDSPGSLCYDCHMPKMTYGIMTFHRNHKIESPDPINEFAIEKPNACVACHLDKTNQWIIDESIKLWPNLAQKESVPLDVVLVQSLVELHSGDPVQRGIAAFQMDKQAESLALSDRKFLIPHLLFAMQDQYPAIRRFSFKSLNTILDQSKFENDDFKELSSLIHTFDFIADNSQRSPIYQKTMDWLKYTDKSNWQAPPIGSLLDQDYQLDMEKLILLRAEALHESKVIHVGE